MGKYRQTDTGRDGKQFVLLPHCVIDSAAWQDAAHPTRSLCVELMRQYNGSNNGRLLASRAHLVKRGWLSNDVISRATHEALALGLIFQTVIGQLPNKAAWFAMTWFKLNRDAKHDVGVALTFKQGAYRSHVARAKKDKKKILTPSDGLISAVIAPSDGRCGNVMRPRDGVIRANFDPKSRPSGGHHIDSPYAMPLVGRVRR